MNKIDVIILAGAPADAAMAPDGALISRAMIPLGAKTMLQWIVDALRSSPSIGRIIAVGDVAADGLDVIVEPGDNLMDNIRRGMELLDSQEHVLIVSSDVPLLTPDAVEDFIKRARRLDVELAYPILPKTHCEKRYPELKRTYLKTADGVFTGGNIMLISPQFIKNNYNSIANAYTARKQIFKLARMIGVGVLLRVIAAQVFPAALKVSMLERAASKMLGAKVGAVVSAYPEIGEDVDKPSDVKAVVKILSSK